MLNFKKTLAVLYVVLLLSVSISIDLFAASKSISEPAVIEAQQLIGKSGEQEQMAPAVVSASPAVSPMAGEQINWQIISAGGAKGASSNFALNSTVGQTAVGTGNSTSYKVSQGFWQKFSCCDKAGDANNDNKVNVGDAVFMINYVFKSGVPPTCKDQADVNGDCKLNVGDIVFLINFVFKSGTRPQCGCASS